MLQAWQRQLLEDMFVVDPATGLRRYRTAYIGVPRKNGKSTLGAALALYGLLMDGEPGAEVLSVAGDRSQASLVFHEARAMVEADPFLSERIRTFRYHLEVPETHSVYRVLSSDSKRQQGLNPSFVVFDEVHVQPNTDLWTAMTLGAGTRRQPMVMGITTAGFDRETLAWKLYEHGRNIQAGIVQDPSFFFRWWEPRDPNCALDDRQAWAEANPALGLTLKESALEDDLREPESSFRRYHLNQWTSTYAAWLPHGAWQAIEDKARAFDPAPPFVAFLDGSWANDSTGIVGCTLDRPHLSVLGHWMPDTDLGHVDMAAIEKRTREVLAMPGCKGLAFDPARFQDFFARLEAEGHRVIEWPTNSLARMVPACQEFYTAVMERTVTHDGDPRLAAHIGHAVLKEDHRGPRIVKEAKSSRRKIDLAVCAVGALSEAKRLAATPRPTYFAAVSDTAAQEDDDEW